MIDLIIRYYFLPRVCMLLALYHTMQSWMESSKQVDVIAAACRAYATVCASEWRRLHTQLNSVNSVGLDFSDSLFHLWIYSAQLALGLINSSLSITNLGFDTFKSKIFFYKSWSFLSWEGGSLLLKIILARYNEVESWSVSQNALY